IYCLGDLVNFAGWDNEVIHLVRQSNIPTVQGNHDEGIGFGKTTFPFSFSGAEQKAFGHASILKVDSVITGANRAFLRNLPFSLQLECRYAFHSIRIHFTHGSPLSNNEYIEPNVPDDVLRALLDSAGADILLLGHTHRPFHQPVFQQKENRLFYRHVINAGSVGKPKHGNPDACYVLLDFDDQIRMEEPASLSVRFRYVPYDTDATLRHIHALGLGSAYDHFLRYGQPTSQA
ncbi:MAG TPA: metallophosphoesterase family protein, partial [Puia sp.]|nr:metallophosphoesterase family protein [Puia sp.]